MTKLALYCQDLSKTVYAEALAARLHLPLVFAAEAADLFVLVDAEGLGLLMPGCQPLRVEFSKTLAARVRQEGRQLPLAKALGLQKPPYPRVLDATAGLGRDAFLLTALGCELHLTEENPILYALLEAALPAYPHFVGRMHLHPGRAEMWMPQLAVDVIYLDPMFPKRQKSALVKKDMQILQSLLGEEDQAGPLLTAALATQVKRVVIKRPAASPKLFCEQLTFCVESKTHRFDVYVRLG